MQTQANVILGTVQVMYVVTVLLDQLATLARTQTVHRTSVEEMVFVLMAQMDHLVMLVLLALRDHVQGIINVLMVLSVLLVGVDLIVLQDTVYQINVMMVQSALHAFLLVIVQQNSVY